MEIFIAIVAIVFGILQIVLFFKLWGMTDDVRAIKNKYLKGEENKEPLASDRVFEMNALVVDLKTEKQMRAGALVNGKYKCFSGGIFTGDFSANEIMLFDEWVKGGK